MTPNSIAAVVLCLFLALLWLAMPGFAAQSLVLKLDLMDAVVKPGDEIRYTLSALPPGTSITGVVVGGPATDIPADVITVAPTANGTLRISKSAPSGPTHIRAIGRGPDGSMLHSDSFRVIVDTEKEVMAVKVSPAKLIFHFPGETRRLRAFGAVEDGTVLDLAYLPRLAIKPQDARILSSIANSGKLIATRPGKTMVDITYQSSASRLTKSVEVEVFSPQRGDFDNDGIVTHHDVEVLRGIITETISKDGAAIEVFDESVGPEDARDLDRDGLLTNNDLAVLAKLCGSACGPVEPISATQSGAVHEPQSSSAGTSRGNDGKTATNPPASSTTTLPNPDLPIATSPRTATVSKPSLPVNASSGMMIWSGQVDRDGTIQIDGLTTSSGTLRGDALPGVPVVVMVEPKELVIAQAPAASNGFKKLILRSPRRQNITVTIRWSAVQ